MHRRRILSAALVGTTAAALGTGGVLAQTYPSRPLKMIVPWPPGQATDLAGRVAAQEISKGLGVPVIVENKAGAGGTIGAAKVAKAGKAINSRARANQREKVAAIFCIVTPL